jgi:type IV secretory pathway TrbF-like protein
MLSTIADSVGGSELRMETEFYLQARREWDERYGDLVLGKRDWQIALKLDVSATFAITPGHFPPKLGR